MWPGLISTRFILRNLLIHEYFGVDVGILWQTIQEDLPPLEPLLRKVLASSDAG
jgi:uncharacterized protein with HEPN domain